MNLLQQISTISALILFVLFVMFGEVLYGQHHSHADPVSQPLFLAIDEAKSAGELTLDESLLQKFYAGYRPSLLNSEFKSYTPQAPVKCMVPALQQYHLVKNQLSSSTVSEIDNLTQSSASTTEFSYTSPSGNFVFHYDTTGTHRVPSGQTIPEAIDQNIPDYIYHAAFAADSSYRYQVENIEFTNFIKDPPYEIDFQNFGFYGTTTSSGSTSFITIHSNFKNFPPNTHPEGHQIGALYATLAHEIKHAVQYSANRWRGSAGSFNWIEMDATLMEEIVFDNVNDYYNYIRKNFDSDEPNSSSIFGNPQKPTPGAYWHITWMLYFSEVYGMDFWVDVWEDVQAEPLIPFADAIDGQLTLRGEDFASNHVRNHLWHLGSGSTFSQSDFGFQEREFYPEPSIGFELISIPDSLSETRLRSLAAQYIQAATTSTAIGQPNIRLTSTTPGVGIGVIGSFRDGTSQYLYTVDEPSTSQEIQTPWAWNELTDLKIVVVNTNRESSSNYTLVLDSILPEEDFLAQNYPNPFNPSTRIEFSLSNRKDVRVEIYDSIGRKITTLLNETLNEGFHFVDFDGSGLASGVYFYRIITDQTVTTNKMTLIK